MAGAGGLTLLTAGIFFLVFGVIYPPPGQPLATVDVTPGQTFVADWIADGYPKRAWLDFDCYGCAFPFRGSAVVEADGARVAEVPIEVWTSSGYAVSSYEGGNENKYHAKLLFDVPALPSGAHARIHGVMTVPAPTIVWSSDPNPQPTPPQFQYLRFWVAN